MLLLSLASMPLLPRVGLDGCDVLLAGLLEIETSRAAMCDRRNTSLVVLVAWVLAVGDGCCNGLGGEYDWQAKSLQGALVEIKLLSHTRNVELVIANAEELLVLRPLGKRTCRT